MKFLQPTLFPNRSMDETDTRGDRTVIGRIFRRMIRAAIESFPIQERKKAELLKSIMQKKAGGNSNDALR